MKKAYNIAHAMTDRFRNRHVQSSLRRGMLPIAALLLVACGTIGPITPTATQNPAAGTPQATVIRATQTATPTIEAVILPTAVPTNTPAPTATPESAWLPGEIRVYPGPLHYAGDILSFEVPIENADDLAEPENADLYLDGNRLGTGDAYVTYSPLRSAAVVFRWAWDTTAQAGIHELRVVLPTQGDQQLERTFHVEVLPASQRPEAEQNAEWETVRTACCRLDYVTNTAADRDIETIARRAEESVSAVEEKFGFDIDKVFPIILLDNIWGNGAYASSEIVLSYVDRPYVSLDLDSVIRHEATHYAAREVGTEAPTLLVEGVAVYISGGHYKPEPIPERAAALLELDLYIPLEDLAADFRAHQHEIAYLEAAGLIAYLDERYGWDQFLELYGIDNIDASSEAEWLDEALMRVYGLDLDDMEASYIHWLEELDASSQVDDLRLTIELFDTIRRYQDLYAPYQEDMPPLEESQDRGITAEFVREPNTPENVALEALLVTTREAVEEGRTFTAEELLVVINTTLADGNFTRAPVSDYVAIARALAAAGYEAQRIDLGSDEARVVAIRNWPILETLTLQRLESGWQIVVSTD